MKHKRVCPTLWSVIDSLLGTVQEREITVPAQALLFPTDISQKPGAHIPLKGRREGNGLQVPSADGLLKDVGR